MPALKDWLDVRSRLGLDKNGNPKPGWVDSGYFFITKNGTPLGSRNLRRPFHLMREQAGLRHQTPHGLRHFFATQQMIARENPRIVQAQLGHSRVGVTLDIYSHVAGLERQSMNRVTDLLLDSPKEKSG
jgi:integrase